MSLSSKQTVVGCAFIPQLSIAPANANGYTMEWASADPNVGCREWEWVGRSPEPRQDHHYLRVTDQVSKNTWSVSMEVEVIQAASEVYGFLANNSSWIKIPTANSREPELLARSSDMIYAQESYDGKVYAYGIDPTRWSDSMWNFYVLDPQNLCGRAGPEHARRIPPISTT